MRANETVHPTIQICQVWSGVAPHGEPDYRKSRKTGGELRSELICSGPECPPPYQNKVGAQTGYPIQRFGLLDSPRNDMKIGVPPEQGVDQR